MQLVSVARLEFHISRNWQLFATYEQLEHVKQAASELATIYSCTETPNYGWLYHPRTPWTPLQTFLFFGFIACAE
jgi:hypothetical protein